MTRPSRMLPILLLLLISAGSVFAQYTDLGQERITYYGSDIVVHKDASMTVTETIKVVALGNEIKRGIYRDFPTRYRGRFGLTREVRFDVLAVTRDGNPEPYRIEDRSNGKRIYIGEEGVFLSPGLYTYTITYVTDQLGFFEDHDELYWNATGNGWAFPIEQAAAVVTLPEGVKPQSVRVEGYTGPQGAEGQDYNAYVNEDGQAVFTTTRRLSPKEGLTIVVSWPKGIVAEPANQLKLAEFLRANVGFLVGLAGLVIVLLYFLAAWSRVGRDPAKGTIIPLYTPPEGFSPAAVRYLCRMGYDNKTFACALIDMAIKGYVRIEETGKSFTVVRDKADGSVLEPEELDIAEKLLGSGDRIELDDANYREIGGAGKLARTSLRGRYSGYFSRNSGWFAIGAILSAITLALSVFLLPAEQASTVGFMSVWLSIWTVGVAALVTAVIKAWRGIPSGVRTKSGSTMGAGCLTLFAIPFVVGEIVGIGILVTQGPVYFPALILLFGVMNYLFFHLLKAPTPQGRKILDRIEGFRMYLSVAEGDELKAMEEPPKTPELYEKYLPYALALDVEQQWSERFADVLARAGVRDEGYSPRWYSGSGYHSFSTGAFASSLGSSLSGAISSSSSPPGSSSGSGGGGSSGGGGGGGGGGGW